ncbi:ABC transporter B family member 26, chloroplastic [Linum perenne]
MAVNIALAFREISIPLSSAMALLQLSITAPRLLPSRHRLRVSGAVDRRSVRLVRDTKYGFSNLSFKASDKFASVRYAPLVRCASVNGYTVENGGAGKVIDGGVEEADGNDELHQRIRGFIEFLPSILPGGNWWSLSDDVDVKLVAEPVTVWRALGRMWQLVARDRWIIFAAFSALILAAVSEISIPHYLTASIFTAQSADVPTFHRNVRLLVLLCVTSGICSGLRGCCFGIANMILVKRMRETLYSSLLLQDISFFDDETVGDLTSRLGSDCQQVSRVIGNDLNLILRNVVQGTGALTYLLILSRPLGLCTLFICSVLAAVMTIYGMYQKKAARLTQEFTASANDVAQETLSLIRTVRVYGTEKLEQQRYNLWLDRLADISLKQSAAYGIWNLSFNTLYHSTQVIAVLLGGMSILAGHITAEHLTKFILYSEWLIFSTWWVGDNLSSLMQSVGASEKVFKMMDLLPSDQFVAKGNLLLGLTYLAPFTITGLQLQNIKGSIDFQNISFHYPSRESVQVLQHVNLTVHPGEVIAIVGLSGSGKSTMVNLLLRLYEPTSGQILIDGTPLQDLDIRWFRERIGYVGQVRTLNPQLHYILLSCFSNFCLHQSISKQEPKLFRMDLSSNISYGCPRDVTQEEIEHAAKEAYAHDFITSLPDGYRTIVDDDLLSGGQKQRIAIARAILRDPSILILDEATSALDAESEHNVKGVIRSLRSDSMSRRTVIVIAHRLSTIQAADRIVVMGNGEVLEMGRHKELLLKDGLYAQLTRRQADAVA